MCNIYLNDEQKQQALKFALIFPRGTISDNMFEENYFFKKIKKKIPSKCALRYLDWTPEGPK